jgi:hypothetical protein
MHCSVQHVLQRVAFFVLQIVKKRQISVKYAARPRAAQPSIRIAASRLFTPHRAFAARLYIT